MKIAAKIYMALLLLMSAGMLVWGLAGFFEYFTGIKPFIKLQNDAYPGGVQFVHWLLITLSGSIFLGGYITRWKWTPFAMITIFSNLAVLCTIETFDFMSAQWSFSSYFTEIVLYLVHATFLLQSAISKARFNHCKVH